jgi:hypothetical protein
LILELVKNVVKAAMVLMVRLALQKLMLATISVVRESAVELSALSLTFVVKVLFQNLLVSLEKAVAIRNNSASPSQKLVTANSEINAGLPMGMNRLASAGALAVGSEMEVPAAMAGSEMEVPAAMAGSEMEVPAAMAENAMAVAGTKSATTFAIAANAIVEQTVNFLMTRTRKILSAEAVLMVPLFKQFILKYFWCLFFLTDSCMMCDAGERGQ